MTDVPKHHNHNIWIASVQVVYVGVAQASPNKLEQIESKSYLSCWSLFGVLVKSNT